MGLASPIFLPSGLRMKKHHLTLLATHLEPPGFILRACIGGFSG